MNYKTILITGGAGFIGSNLAVLFKQKYPYLNIIALDNLKRRGSEINVSRLKDSGIHFVHGDIRVPEDLILNAKIDLLIDCCAEPSVLAGFGDNPAYIINTNLAGTVNCLELARKNKAGIVFLSTSRVYPYERINDIKLQESETRFDWQDDQTIEGWSKEGIGVDFTTQGAKTLYGATKLCSEILVQEYIKNYDLKGVINRCGVIAGPGQFGKSDQGVFTFWMLAHYFKRDLKYIGFGGKGKQVRDLLHINDLFELLNSQLLSLDKVSGKIYNAGGGRKASLSLMETTKICAQITGNRVDIGEESGNRPGDISIYITDNEKVSKDLNWHPVRSAQEILKDTYNWINANESRLKQSLF